MGKFRYLVVCSEEDPVAHRVWSELGALESTGLFLEGTAIRQWNEQVAVLHRPGFHIHDERLDAKLPQPLVREPLPMVFPSIHRSEQGIDCLTVHPLGNLGSEAEVGGSPRALTPTAPRLMTGALRQIAELAPSAGLPATFEATHHGPLLGVAAFFMEIGFGAKEYPPEPALKVLMRVLPSLEESSGDRIAMGVGGGHYAPHFTALALDRRWSFGHLISRHALGTLSEAVAREAWQRTPEAEGILFTRAEDFRLPVWEGWCRRLKDSDASRRPPRTLASGSWLTSGASSASGT